MKILSYIRRPLKTAKPDWLVVLALITAGVIVYANSFSNSFVWDDELLVTSNRSITSLRAPGRFFTAELAPKIGGNFYRPLQSLSYAFDYLFWGLRPFGYHLTNLLIHLANAIFIYFILLILTRRRLLSSLTSLLFLVHPIQTEAVTYLSGRADILAAFFLLASLLLFLISRAKANQPSLSCHCEPQRGEAISSNHQHPPGAEAMRLFRRHGENVAPRNDTVNNENGNFRTIIKGPRYKRDENSIFTLKNIFLSIAAVICFILALLTKEAALVFPLLAVLGGLFLTTRSKGKGCCLSGKTKFLYASLFLLAAAYLSIRALTAGAPGEPLSSNPYPFYARFLTSFKVVILYIRTLLIPFPLHMERVIPIERSFFSFAVLLPLLFLAGLAIITVRAYRRAPLLFLGIAWFFLALLPYLNWFPLNAEMAEHWLYLPSVGFFLIIVLFTESLPSRLNGSRAVQKLSDNSLSTFVRGHCEERSKPSPAKAGEAISSSLVLSMILICYSVLTIDRNRDWRNNENIYTHTARYSPESPRAHYNLGNIRLQKGEKSKAIEEFRRALEIKPWDFQSHRSLGKALLGLGLHREAIKELEEAVSLRPASAGAHNELGVAYGLAGWNEKAVSELKRAIKLDPGSARTHSNLASIYTNLAQFSMALTQCERALDSDPDMVEANFNLGVIYYHLKKRDRAADQFQRVLRLQPDFTRAADWLRRLKVEESDR